MARVVRRRQDIRYNNNIKPVLVERGENKPFSTAVKSKEEEKKEQK